MENSVCSVILVICYLVVSPAVSQLEIKMPEFKFSDEPSYNETVEATLPSGKKWRVVDPKMPLRRNCIYPQYSYEYLLSVLLFPGLYVDEYGPIKEELRTQLQFTNVTWIRRLLSPCVWLRYKSYRDTFPTLAEANETFLFSIYDHLDRVEKEGYDGALVELNEHIPSGLMFNDRDMDKLETRQGWFLYLNRVALGRVYYMEKLEPMTKPPDGYHSIAVARKGVVYYMIARGEQIYPEYQISVSGSTSA